MNLRTALCSVFAIVASGLLGSGCIVDTTYTSCFDDLDCNGIDLCYTVDSGPAIGEFCSYSCIDDFDCESNLGFSGACYDFAGAPDVLCYQRCDLNIDCFASSRCVDVVDDFGVADAVCVPDN